MYPNYEQDPYGWATHTAHLLRENRISEVDFGGILEELEDMGGSHENQLISRLAQLVFHLLKWQYQPALRGRSWEGSIEEQRKRIQILLRRNPSLKSKVEEALTDAYDVSLSLIRKETPLDLKLLPPACPYTFEQVTNDVFYPEHLSS